MLSLWREMATGDFSADHGEKRLRRSQNRPLGDKALACLLKERGKLCVGFLRQIVFGNFEHGFLPLFCAAPDGPRWQVRNPKRERGALLANRNERGEGQREIARALHQKAFTISDRTRSRATYRGDGCTGGKQEKPKRLANRSQVEALAEKASA